MKLHVASLFIAQLDHENSSLTDMTLWYIQSPLFGSLGKPRVKITMSAYALPLSFSFRAINLRSFLFRLALFLKKNSNGVQIPIGRGWQQPASTKR